MTADEARAIRNVILQKTDLAMIPDYPIQPWDRDWMNGLRIQLRNLTDQATFPTVIEWPVFPEWAIEKFGLGEYTPLLCPTPGGA